MHINTLNMEQHLINAYEYYLNNCSSYQKIPSYIWEYMALHINTYTDYTTFRHINIEFCCVGYASYVYPRTGSVYIQAFVDVMAKYAGEDSVQNLLPMVCKHNNLVLNFILMWIY